jgi:hypothetical protein
MREARARDGRRASETEEDPTDATAAGQGALTAGERSGGEDFGVGSSLEQGEDGEGVDSDFVDGARHRARIRFLARLQPDGWM